MTLFKGQENKLSLSRYSQLKNLIREEDIHNPIPNDIDMEDRLFSIKENKWAHKEAIFSILEDPDCKPNKTTLKKLHIFLANYISTLSHEDYNHLYKILNYYIKKVNAIFPLEEDEIWNLLSRDKPMIEMVKTLILKWFLLPESSTQEDFNNDMKFMLQKFEEKFEKDVSETPFSIDAVSVDFIMDNVEANDKSIFIWWMPLEWIANRFTFKFSLQKETYEARMLSQTTSYLFKDEISYYFRFWKIWDYWLDREDMLTYLKSNSDLIDNSTFFIAWNRYLSLNCEVKRIFVDDWLWWKPETQKEFFDLEFFVEPKKEMDTYDFVDKSMELLDEETIKFMNKISEYFWVLPEIQNKICIEPDDFNYEESDEWGSEVAKLNKTTKESWSAKNSQKNKEKEKQIDKFDSNNPVKSIDDMILEESEKNELKKIVHMFNHPKHFANYWLEISKWMILYWPPGVWKTLFLKLLAKLTDAEFILITHDEIEWKYVWESEKNIKAKFNQARELVAKWKKVIMAFDEWDSLLEARGKERNNKEWIISIILAELDWFDPEASKNIFVTILTNRPEAVDPALKERLNIKVWLSLPSFSQRIEHIKLNINHLEEKAGKKIFNDDIDFTDISNKLDKKSGRFIKSLINNTVRNYADELLFKERDLITTSDIIAAIKYTKENEDEISEKVMWFWRQNEK